MGLDSRTGWAHPPRGSFHRAGVAVKLPGVVPVTSNEIKVLGALLDQFKIEGRCTLRGACERLGTKPGSTVSHALGKLRENGLVTFEDGRTGTIRPAVRVVG